MGLEKINYNLFWNHVIDDLSAFDETKDQDFLEMAETICNFLLDNKQKSAEAGLVDYAICLQKSNIYLLMQKLRPAERELKTAESLFEKTKKIELKRKKRLEELADEEKDDVKLEKDESCFKHLQSEIALLEARGFLHSAKADNLQKENHDFEAAVKNYAKAITYFSEAIEKRELKEFKLREIDSVRQLKFVTSRKADACLNFGIIKGDTAKIEEAASNYSICILADLQGLTDDEAEARLVSEPYEYSLPILIDSTLEQVSYYLNRGIAHLELCRMKSKKLNQKIAKTKNQKKDLDEKFKELKEKQIKIDVLKEKVKFDLSAVINISVSNHQAFSDNYCEAYYRLAELNFLVGSGPYDGTLGVLDEIAARRPNYFDKCNYLKSKIQGKKLHDVDAVIESLSEILRKKPDDILKRVERARNYLRNRKYTQAKEDIKMVIEDYGYETPVTYSLRGFLGLLTDRKIETIEQTISDFEKTLELYRSKSPSERNVADHFSFYVAKIGFEFYGILEENSFLKKSVQTFERKIKLPSQYKKVINLLAKHMDREDKKLKMFVESKAGELQLQEQQKDLQKIAESGVMIELVEQSYMNMTKTDDRLEKSGLSQI